MLKGGVRKHSISRSLLKTFGQLHNSALRNHFSEDKSCWAYLTYITGLPTVHCGQCMNRPKWLRKVIKGEIKSTSIFYQDFCAATLKYVQNHYLLSLQKIYVLFVLKIVWKIFLCDRYLWKLYWETTFASGIVMFVSNMSIEINVLKWLSEKRIEF